MHAHSEQLIQIRAVYMQARVVPDFFACMDLLMMFMTIASVIREVIRLHGNASTSFLQLVVVIISKLILTMYVYKLSTSDSNFTCICYTYTTAHSGSIISYVHIYT